MLYDTPNTAVRELAQFSECLELNRDVALDGC